MHTGGLGNTLDVIGHSESDLQPHQTSQLDSPAPTQLTRITLRPIATPFPLGFLALACATLLASSMELDYMYLHGGRVHGL
jgi:hypothetical protein